MATARYTVLTPNVPGLAQSVYRYLVEGPVKCQAVNMMQGDPYVHVYAWADETPETDSHFKQLGTYISDTANVPTVNVVKDGKKGLHAWEMRNLHYQPHTVHEDLAGDQGEEPTPDAMPAMATEPISEDLNQPVQAETPADPDPQPQETDL